MKQSISMRVLLCKINCSSFICFCKPSAAHLHTSGHLKFENTPHVGSTVVSVTEASGQFLPEGAAVGPHEEHDLDGRHRTENSLKSCIRKATAEPGTSKEADKKRVQWADNFGKELAKIKEFESCEAGDTDSETENRGCVCAIL